MPFVTAFFIWLGFSAATAGILAGITIGTVLSTAMGFLARALGPKLPKPGPVTRDVTVNQPDAAWQIVYGLRVLGGSLFAIELSGTNNEFLTVGIVWCYGGPDGIESIDQIWFGDEVAVTGTTPITKYSGLITVEHKLGTDAQTANTLLTSLAGRFASTDTGAGHAYTVLKLKFNEQKFSDFTIEKIRAKIKGRKVLDPRTGTVAFSSNPVLCIRDYLVNIRFGLGYGQGARSLPVIMDDAFNNSQANICDELVNKKAGGTRVRYALNMAFTADSEPGRVVQEMFVAMGGGPNYMNGKWRLLAGAWRPPAITIDDDDLRGPVEMKLALGRLNTFNAVRGEFMDPTHWQPTNYPFYAPPEPLAEDGGIRIWQDLDFAGVTDAGQAQQLAKLALEMVRRPKRITLPCKFLAYELAAGDTFRFTHDDWVEKTFAVEKLEPAVENDEQGQMIIGVDVYAREEDPGTYYWNPGVEEGVYTPPPAPILPPPGQGIVSGAGNNSYRPRSNPLTATDAGSNVTVSIASFDMEISGITPAPTVNAGSITALSFDALYFISYKDPSMQGGTVTYEAFATREDAIREWRFFVGSIATPKDGAGDTAGNNDGGTGGQYSKTQRLLANSFAAAGWTNPANGVDADENTYAESTTAGTSLTYEAYNYVNFSNWFTAIVLRIKHMVVSLGSGSALVKYSLDDGGSWITARTISSADGAPVTTAVTLTPSANTAKVRMRLELPATSTSSGPNTAGTAANDAGIGITAWTTPTNAQGAANSVFTTVSASLASTLTTQALKATNFGFALPSTAVIAGIQVEYNRKGTNIPDPGDGFYKRVSDNAARIVKGGTIQSTDRSGIDSWAATTGWISYGSSTDLWGATWLYTDINATTFGGAISAIVDNQGSSGTCVASIDAVRITVFYTTGGGSTTGRVYSMTQEISL